MKARFLFGPSGSGKTFRCLAEVRQALMMSPEGAPLLFVTPKQATFQLERQLLCDGTLPGYTRLQILSFEQLAEFLLVEFGATAPELLNEDGRLMVLRALLSEKRNEFELFHASARLRGFAEQLNGIVRELRRAAVTPAQLLELARKLGSTNDRLDAKLRDLAVLLQAYFDWLKRHQLQDYDHLLILAREAIQTAVCVLEDGNEHFNKGASGRPHSIPLKGLCMGGLWLDGFSELMPAQIELLAALLPLCERATLSFNLDRNSIGQTSWLSTWSSVGQTVERLRQRLSNHPKIETDIEWLERDTPWHRFANNPVLQHLEKHWADGKAYVDISSGCQTFDKAVRLVMCPNPEAEVLVAAREIRRFVRGGGRFREIAVMARDLAPYSEVVRRVFASYDIPFFLDRREPVGHHPLAELTRSALKILAFDWQPEDWFAALKTGLMHEHEEDIDRLENEALARGWKAKDWRSQFQVSEDPPLEKWLEPLRKKLVAPFEALALALRAKASGAVLAEGLRRFWLRLQIGEQLERWSAESLNAVHISFWDQMQLWLENLALAFSNEVLSLKEWLPIIDAGLANQSVGVIPPALDQVLVAAVDRSRSPDVRMAILLGVNESVFPARLHAPNLLSESDRERLANAGIWLSPLARDRLGRERYFGYIACTRARERLVATYALRGSNEEPLNPSPFIEHLQQLIPGLYPEAAELTWAAAEAEHSGDLQVSALQAACGSPSERPERVKQLLALPVFGELIQCLDQFRAIRCDERLSDHLADRLYGKALCTSVSRLEEFAACPFRFFVSSGLRAEERQQFQLGLREQGSFQHEVLARFHQQLRIEGHAWRDISAGEARERVGRVATESVAEFRNGLLAADGQNRFVAANMTTSLQDFIEVVVGWMRQYEFDPSAVELAFGQDGDALPPWNIDLGEGKQLLLRGKIDRVDLCRNVGDRRAACVVIDYKSSAKKLHPILLTNGIQLQLLAYLNALHGIPEARQLFDLDNLVPAGVFYVNLRGQYQKRRTRRQILAAVGDARRMAYRHNGRFDAGLLSKFDNRKAEAGDQFNYSFNTDGKLNKRSCEALDSLEFRRLLKTTEDHLVKMGSEIFNGVADVNPYRRGRTTACDHCGYQAICRIDPWTHRYRVLQKEGR